VAQSCEPMTEELDIAGTPKTGIALRLLMVAIALVSLVPAGVAMVMLILGVTLSALGAGRDLPGSGSWFGVVAAFLLALSTCVTAAVAAMSGDRRSTWVGISLFAVMIVAVTAIRFSVVPDPWKRGPPPSTAHSE